MVIDYFPIVFTTILAYILSGMLPQFWTFFGSTWHKCWKYFGLSLCWLYNSLESHIPWGQDMSLPFFQWEATCASEEEIVIGELILEWE